MKLNFAMKCPQKTTIKECAGRIRRKATFKFNTTGEDKSDITIEAAEKVRTKVLESGLALTRILIILYLIRKGGCFR